MKAARLRAAMLIAAAIAAPAHAADSLLLAGTSETGLGSSYSYLGVLTPLGQGVLGDGWVMRQWIDRLTYRYDGYVPDIHALDYGYSPAIGYQWAVNGETHAALWAGVRLAHTQLEPDDPSNVDRGTHARFTLQGELTSAWGERTQNQFLAQGEFGNGAYFIRDRLAWRVSGPYTLGPEAIAQGSREYQAHEVGLCLGGIPLGRKASLLLRAGVYQQRDQPTAGAGGLELAATF